MPLGKTNSNKELPAIKKRFASFLTVFAGLVSLVFFLSGAPAIASSGTNQQISFEGKLTKADGTNITDGTYNMEFKIYQDGNSSGSGSTLEWTEDYLVGGSGGVSFTSGTFQVNLGSVCGGFGSGTCGHWSNNGVDFNQQTLWLSMQIGNTNSCTVTTNFQSNCSGDGEMTPFIRLSAVPQALNSDKLDGLDSTAFAQLAQAAAFSSSVSIQPSANVVGLTVKQNSNGSPTADIFDVATANNTPIITVSGPSANTSAVTITSVGSQDLTLGSGSGLIKFNSSTTTLQKSSSAFTLDVSNGNSDSTLTVSNSGGTGNIKLALDTGGVFAVGASTGSTAAGCAGGQFVTGTLTGGIITSGSCDSPTTSLQNAYDSSSSPATITTSSGSKGVSVSAGTAPTSDIFSISNSGQASTTAGADGLEINYVGGGAAVEAEGANIDLAPGTTSGGTWNGLKITANATGPVSGVTENGLKVVGPTSPGSGSQIGVNVTTGWDIGLNLDSGGIQMANLPDDPATPASGEFRLYSKLVAGRTMLKALGSSGINYALQPSLFQQNVVLVTGGAGTSTSTYTTLGSNVTASGTLATGSGSTSEALGNTSRIATGTTSGTVAGFYTKNVYYRGSISNGADGYFYFVRLNFNGQTLSNYNTATGARIFAGMCGTTFNNCTNSDSPTTSSAAGFQFSGSRTDTNFQFITCNGSACNLTDTGVAVNNTDTFDMYIYNAPQGSTTYWRIDDVTAGSAPVEGNTGTDLPVGSTALNAGLQIINLSAANRFIYFQRMYFETDR